MEIGGMENFKEGQAVRERSSEETIDRKRSHGNLKQTGESSRNLGGFIEKRRCVTYRPCHRNIDCIACLLSFVAMSTATRPLPSRRV
jgi:hypothetical protein